MGEQYGSLCFLNPCFIFLSFNVYELFSLALCKNKVIRATHLSLYLVFFWRNVGYQIHKTHGCRKHSIYASTIQSYRYFCKAIPTIISLSLLKQL